MLLFGSELVKRGWSVDLVLANLEGALQGLIPSGIRVVNLASSRMLLAIPRLVSYFRQVDPLAVYSTITHANIAATYAAQRAQVQVPVIVRQSNAPLSETKDSFGRFLTSRLIPLAYSKASTVIAVSEGVRQELVAMSARLEERIRVIPTPVLTENIKHQGESIPEHRWFKDRSVPVVVSAGRLKKHKGMSELIRAFKQVRGRTPARLLILGDGPERERLEAEVKEFGLQDDVELVGFQPNPFPFMNHANVFVLASHYEGLPNVLIQAMGFGTPIVATDCPSGPAEILEHGALGRLVPVGAHNELANALRQSLHLPKQRTAQAHAWSRYGADAAVGAYLAVAGLSEPRGANETGEYRLG
jgi:glycosyltransferase involved in cell wall biosynthesis